MLIQIPFKVESIEKARQFYIDELGLFKEITTFGERAVILREFRDENLELYIELGECKNNSNEPSFSMEVKDCSKEFDRIKRINFFSGGHLFKDESEEEATIFEFPLGKNFLLVDPSGNKFLMYEDFYFGSDSTYVEER